MTTSFETLFRDQAMPVMSETFGETYILRRGTDTSEITAERAPHEEEETNERNVRTSWRGVKFTVTASEYILAGVVTTPARDDEFVVYDENGVATVWTVLPPNAKKPVYEKIGDGYQLLVYAKETGTE